MTLVFDTTALGHFARAGELDALQGIVGGYRCVVPAEVIAELVNGMTTYPALAPAVSVSWVEIVELTSVDELVAFAQYKTEFGGGPKRNNGEAAVLAWTRVNGGTAIVDEVAATRAARRDGIDVHGTLWLITNGVRAGVLDRGSAEAIVDALVATGMRLPVDGAGFFAWAYEQGLLP